MGRPLRKRSAADLYHIVARGAGRQIIFEDDSDRSHALSLFSEHLRNVEAEVYGYCLMSNHFHLAIRADLDALSTLMQSAEALYARYFNKRHGHVGHLFQGRFWSEPINDDSYLLEVIRYIHLNPERAKVATALEYPWSSYREYLGDAGVCNTKFVLDMFDSRESFITFHGVLSPDGRQTVTLLTDEGPARLLPDDACRLLACSILGEDAFRNLKGLAKKERDEEIAILLMHGFTIRQIERLTGIGRGIIADISLHVAKPDR